MKRKKASLIITFISVLLMAAYSLPAWGVVIFMKGSDDPLVGYLVHRNEIRVVVKIRTQDGALQERSIPRAEVQDLLISVSPERLHKLRPTNAAEYYHYAEELAEKKLDPEARETALRLYTIAAWLDKEGLGRRAMLGAAAVARTPSEEKKFRAMAFLLDPTHNPTNLQTLNKIADADVSSAKDRQQMIQSLRLLRKGDWAAARRIAERPAVKAVFETMKQVLPYDNFLAACKDKAVSPPLLRQLIAVELALEDAADGTDSSSTSKSNERWSRQIFLEGARPVPMFNLRQLTEFDPDENVFREGQWIRTNN